MVPENIKKPTFYCGSRTRQYYSAFAANFAVTSVGTAWSWTATAIPDINSSSDNSLSPLTSTQEAWITSIAFIGALLACPLSGFFMQKLGVRASMLTLTLPLIGGWVLIIFSTNVWMLLIARFLTGFCAGGVALAVPVFIAETTEIKIRGTLGFGYDIMGSVGQLYIFIVGSLVSWQWQAAACAVIPGIFHILILAVPESPRTLISKNKIEKAKKSLAWFRHAQNTDLIEEEFRSMLEDVETSRQENSTFTVKDYFSMSIIRPTLIGIMLMFFLQACGATQILAHTVDIFEAAGVDNSYLATILVGLTLVIMAIPSAFCVDHVGRRVLLMASALFMALNLGFLGCYMYWKALIPVTYNWIPLACLMLFITGFAIGFGPIPFLLMGEIVPAAAKGPASALIIIFCRLFGFIVLFLYNDIIILVGEHGSCWLFSGSCILAFFYTYFYVPETKGKSLAEIQLFFENKQETNKV